MARSQIRFDAKAFLLNEIGPVARIVDLLRLYGMEEVTSAMVQKWLQRDGIPGLWFPRILSVLEIDRGERISVARYIVGVEAPR